MLELLFATKNVTLPVLTDLYLPGAWTAVFSLDLSASGLEVPHHTWAKFRKNSWSASSSYT